MLKILLTNDDGIEAPGLMALADTIRQLLSDEAEFTVMAPDRGRSECGHSVTTGRPLRLTTVRDRWVAVDGTPVDCVRAAMCSIDQGVDIVLSGINSGANLGVDLMVSGTFAAAREAAIHGVAAMAISHYRREDVAKTWHHVTDWLARPVALFIEEFHRRAGESNRDRTAPLWNVNLPAIDPSSPPPPLRRCGVDPSPMVRRIQSTTNETGGGGQGGRELNLHSDFHGRPRLRGLDVDLCFGGSITLSSIHPHPETTET